MKQVCYFERVLDPELFERILTEDGDITLSRVDREMSEDATLKALRLEMEQKRRMREVYRQRKELEIDIEE